MAASPEALKLGLENAINRIKELEVEHDYLLAWLRHRYDEPQPLTGLSAKELTRVAFGQPRHDGEYPRDAADLGRCERAYEAMPPHLQERALPLLEQWRDAVADHERGRGR